MKKLIEMLERGEMPDFLQMVEALNEISDLDWEAIEACGLTFPEALDKKINKLKLLCQSGRCKF